MSSNTTVVWTGTWAEFVEWAHRHRLRRSRSDAGVFTDAAGGRYVGVSTRGGWERLRGLDLRGSDLVRYGSWEDGDEQNVQDIAQFLLLAGLQRDLIGLRAFWGGPTVEEVAAASSELIAMADLASP